jgi:P-type Cu2+ transporter
VSANDPASRAAAPARDCFHCGLPVPAGPVFSHQAAGEWRAFCCPGCEAVSQSISGLGLDDYYRLRASPAPRPDGEADSDLAIFDDALVQSRFVREAARPARAAGDPPRLEAQLILEGLRCSACAWLIEQVVTRLPGVASIDLNYTTRRAWVRWDPAVAKLSAVLAAIRTLGYGAWPYEEGRLALIEQREKRALLRRLWVAGLGMMQVMMYAVPTYLAGDGEITADAASLMRWAGLVLTLPVMAYSAAPFFRGAWRDLRVRTLGMDVPIVLGLLSAFVASVVATLAGTGEVYFDSVTMFVFLITGGRYLELLARHRAGESLERLARLVPQVANRLAHAASRETSAVAVARLAAGDLVLVRPGEAVPADGELESDAAEVSEAWLSGESRPALRRRGEAVLGGSVNAGSALVMRVTRVGADTALSAVHRLLERALGERPRWVAAAQRASAFFVGFILLAALAAGLAWLAIDPARALWVAVSLLIVTCPCALALATPVAVTAATGAMARANLVVARGHAIERLASATDIVFDKTGTLTHGRPRLLETMALGVRSRDESLGIAAALARWSSHPVDRALAECGTGGDLRVEAHESVAGAGIEARIDGRRVRLGRAGFVAALAGSPAPVAWIRSQDSVAYLGDETGWIAGFRLGDTLREDARGAIAGLRALGLRIHLLSGDEPGVVQRVAAELGIDAAAARATPEAKLRAVRELQRLGARVAMVGDGINDAPVLAQADVSVAMGGGADLAQMQADAVLLSDSPQDLLSGVRIARRARRIVRQNLAWALAYNLVAVPLAFAGLVTPLLAGIGMSASSLVVVANAARLRR